MGFWLFCAVMCLMIPGVVLFFGRRFLKHPPKNINSLYGYRTTRSMKNQQTWDFAHETCGRLWVRLGMILLVLSLIALALVFGQDVETVGIVSGVLTAIQTVVLVGSIFPVERALKRNFDDFGRKKE